jgi:hypothetical protein
MFPGGMKELRGGPELADHFPFSPRDASPYPVSISWTPTHDRYFIRVNDTVVEAFQVNSGFPYDNDWVMISLRSKERPRVLEGWQY